MAQPYHHPPTHHHSFADSAAETGLVPEIASLSPHRHNQITQPTYTRQSQTNPPRLMAIVDTCIKHSGRLPIPQRPTTCSLARRHPPPEAAPTTLCLTHYALLRIKNPHNKLPSYFLHLTFQQSLVFLRSHLNSRRAATCLPLRLLTTPWTTTLRTGIALLQSLSK